MLPWGSYKEASIYPGYVLKEQKFKLEALTDVGTDSK